jgi:hypothetical protein
VLLMDRFPTAEEIVQLPCLPLMSAPAAALVTATPSAAAAGAGAAASGRVLQLAGQQQQQWQHDQQHGETLAPMSHVRT